MVFAFLIRLVEEANTLGVFKTHTFYIKIYLLSGRGEKHIQSIQNGTRFFVITCWPKTVHPFFCTRATPAAISSTVNNLRNIRQQAHEDKIPHGESIDSAPHGCCNVSMRSKRYLFF